jgi:hypothetical protein
LPSKCSGALILENDLYRQRFKKAALALSEGGFTRKDWKKTPSPNLEPQV